MLKTQLDTLQRNPVERTLPLLSSRPAFDNPYIYDERLWSGLHVNYYSFDPFRLQNQFYQFSPPLASATGLNSRQLFDVLFHANSHSLLKMPSTHHENR